MRLYLITILLVTISILSEVLAKQELSEKNSVIERKDKKLRIKNLASELNDMKRRSKRQNEPQEETPAILKEKEDVTQTENTITEENRPNKENETPETEKNKNDVPQSENKPTEGKKDKKDDSSSSESNESGQKKGKNRRSLRIIDDMSNSKSDESKETKILLAKVNKIRRSLKKLLKK